MLECNSVKLVDKVENIPVIKQLKGYTTWAPSCFQPHGAVDPLWEPGQAYR